jgi:hypothetical protein
MPRVNIVTRNMSTKSHAALIGSRFTAKNLRAICHNILSGTNNDRELIQTLWKKHGNFVAKPCDKIGRSGCFLGTAQILPQRPQMGSPRAGRTATVAPS